MQGFFFSCSSSSEFKGLYFSHYNDDCLSLMNFTEIRISLLLVIPPSMWNFNKGGRRALRFMIFGRKTDLNCKWFWHINIHNMRLVLHVERRVRNVSVFFRFSGARKSLVPTQIPWISSVKAWECFLEVTEASGLNSKTKKAKYEWMSFKSRLFSR